MRVTVLHWARNFVDSSKAAVGSEAHKDKGRSAKAKFEGAITDGYSFIVLDGSGDFSSCEIPSEGFDCPCG